LTESRLPRRIKSGAGFFGIKLQGGEHHMSDELVFYTNPQSRGRLVRWMLEEVGQPYRTEVLDYSSTMKAPAYLAIIRWAKCRRLPMAVRW
jgi:hypothetical protein